MSRRLKRKVAKATTNRLTVLSAEHVIDKGKPLLEMPEPWVPLRRIPLQELSDDNLRTMPFNVSELWINGWYQVFVRRVEMVQDAPGYAHLMVVNESGTPCRSHRDLQRIKTEICGEEATAVDIFGPKREYIKQGGTTHLWVIPAECLPPQVSPLLWARLEKQHRDRIAAEDAQQEASA